MPTKVKWLVIVLKLFRCFAIVPPLVIFMWNNFFIKNTLFDADDFSYIRARTVMKSLIFLFENIESIDENKESMIVPRAFLSSTSKSPSDIVSGRFLFFPFKRLKEISLIHEIPYLCKVCTIELLSSKLCEFTCLCHHLSHSKWSL